MAALTERLRAARESAHWKRLWKYAAVSVVSTVVTQSVLFVTYHVIDLATAMECNVIATAVATVPAYWLNRTWTWGKRGKSHPWKEIAPFWIISFVGLVLSTVAVGLAAHNADRISSSKTVEVLLVQFANLFTYGLIWIGRYLVFNRFLFGEATRVSPPLDVAGSQLEPVPLEPRRADSPQPSGGGELAAGGH